uniref:Pol polyprotein n=1 Tax=Cajanus cajan TaxID=3821 RepID=A0A151TIC6_CAJCA|nr:Pol polyprotein [Cajanus cajan]
MGGERAQAVNEEIAKLLEVGFIREIKYTTWLANVIMVKMANGKWRMCTNYTNLNKACPKDAYPLPHIDTLVLVHQLTKELHLITTPWPFSMWGMDILGLFPPAKGQVKFLIVAIDHFTKWIEVEAVATISTNNVQKFFWKNIITRFGVPHALVTDNGLQFTNCRFNEFLEGLQIKHRMTSVEHPQTNGQVQAANKVILRELKRRLG